MKTLQEIQIEQRAWALKNFGERPSWHPLMGVMEELGELAHSLLKREQGIRGTRAEHDANIRDAVGDIMIFLMDFCSCEDVIVVHIAPKGVPLSPHVELFLLQQQLGALTYWYVDLLDASINEEVRGFVHCLATFCSTQGLDLLTVVNETWDRVSKRDWTKNKLTGGGS